MNKRSPVLRISMDDLIQRDDYGVDGSTFYECKLCGEYSGAGLLNKGIEHEPSCPVARYLERVKKRAANKPAQSESTGEPT